MLRKSIYQIIIGQIKRITESSSRVAFIPHSSSKSRGRALVSYLKDAAEARDESVFTYHSNKWECCEIVRILASYGFDVDVIDYCDSMLDDVPEYSLIFDIHENLQRYAPFLPKSSIKLLHITGSYPYYSVQRELDRVKELEKRRDSFYSPKRIVDCGYFQKSLDIANACSLIGNKHTLSTFPVEYHKKISMITPSTSFLSEDAFSLEGITERRKGFLWFNGFGAVHKGLDLLLEVFAKRPDLQLHIVGNIESEKDFIKIYRKELFESSWIKLHGFLSPSSSSFNEIIRSCSCFIAPSCSEGISVASVTCMKAGLFPIISIDNGIDLPNGAGIILNDCSVNEIEGAIEDYLDISEKALIWQIERCREFANNEYSREAFSRKMKLYFESVLER